MSILGTSGDDDLNGTTGDDIFVLKQGGDDTVHGLGGNDIFNFGDAFTETDHVDGGGGSDTLRLNGGGLVHFMPTTMVNVETIRVTAGHNYNLQPIDATIAAGKGMTIDATELGSSNTLTVYDTSETNGNLVVNGGAGDDFVSGGHHHTLVNGGDGNDSVYLNGGVNVVNSGNGNDYITVSAPIATNSHFDGGTGYNQIGFGGDFSGGQTIGATWGTNINAILFFGGNSYRVTLQDGLVQAGHTLYFYGNAVHATDTLTINGAQISSGSLYLQGGSGDDRLIGGADNDGFEARVGHDTLTGGGGNDMFLFDGISDSTGPAFDRITDFDADHDRLSFNGLTNQIAGFDTAVTMGGLSTNNFDTQLAARIGASELHANDAVLFTPSAGNLAGHIMLIVDSNGTAGYQAGADYVVDIKGMTGTLDINDIQ